MQREDICTLQIAGVVDSFAPFITRNTDTEDYEAKLVIMLSKEKLEEEIQDGTVQFSNIYISTDKPYDIDEELEKVKELPKAKQNELVIYGRNLYEQRLEEESIQKLIKVVLYTFDIIIIVFCMTNIFYIISSSTIFRKKDFAVLRSLGMSEKQIDWMLILEGVFYGFSGLAFGTIFSIGGLCLLGKYTMDSELYLFNISVVQILYASILVYTVVFFAILSARRRVKNKNIIEEVRRENI